MLFRINTPGPSYIVDVNNIYEAVSQVVPNLPVKRGYKVTKQDTMLEIAGKMHRAVYVSVFNTKNRKMTGAVVYDTEPAKSVQVRNPWNPQLIMTCTNKDVDNENVCGSPWFYEVGRSLDYDNWQCASCGREMHTLTETGMSR